MFRQLATALAAGPGIANATAAANGILTTHRPSQLSEFLEMVWSAWRNPARQTALGPGVNPAGHQAMARTDVIDPVLRNPLAGVLDPAINPPPWEPVQWHHLIYAYMLENTRMIDIFRRVLYEWIHGERLPTPTQATQRWMHATEQLFFSQAPWYSVRAVTSNLRPDHASVRRNAYYRLLGMDLNHGTDDGRPYPYIKAEAANRDFAMLFETLLAEVWRGYANRNTQFAENQTDDNAIENLVRRLREMLMSRRESGALSREEFDAVAMISWFHLTVEYDTQVVVDLNARAEGIADRLKKIGERVGLPAHARSDSYFQIAAPISGMLLAIESGAVANAADLYDDTGFYQQDMINIITHWSIVTGRNVKDPSLRKPLGVLAAAGSGAGVVGGNGGAPVNRLAGVLG